MTAMLRWQKRRPAALCVAMALMGSAIGGGDAALLAVGQAAGQNTGAPRVPSGGAPLPSQSVLEFHKAFLQDLEAKSAGVVGKTDPNGNAVSPSTVRALVLTKDMFVADMQGYITQLNNAQGLPIAQKDAFVKQMAKDALDFNSAYNTMVRAHANASDAHGLQKSMYQEFMTEAARLDAIGPNAKDGYGKNAQWFRESAENSAYGWFIKTQQKFYKMLEQNPMMALRKDGQFVFQAYARSAYGAPAIVDREILNDFIDATRAQAYADMNAAKGLTTLADLWKFGGPKYSKQHAKAAAVGKTIGASLPALHITELESVFEGYQITKDENEAFWNSAKDLALGVVAAGSILIPVAGPFIAAGVTAIQIYRDGDDLIVAYTDEADARNTAVVTGYTHVITAEEKSAAAGGKLAFTVISGLGDLAALKNVKFVSRMSKAEREAVAAARSAFDAANTPADLVAAAAKQYGDEAARAVTKMQDLGMSAYDIKKVLNATETPLKTAANLYNFTLVDGAIAEARAAGVSQASIDAVIERAKANLTGKGALLGGQITTDLKVLALNEQGATFVLKANKTADEIFTLAEFQRFTNVSPGKVLNFNVEDLAQIEAKVRLLAKDPARAASVFGVRLTDAETEILFKEIVPRGDEVMNWHVVLAGEDKGVSKVFGQQFLDDLDTLQKAFPQQWAARAGTFGAPTAAETALAGVVGPKTSAAATKAAAKAPLPVTHEVSQMSATGQLTVDPSKSKIFGTLEGAVAPPGYSLPTTNPALVSGFTDAELSQAMVYVYNNPDAVSAAFKDALTWEAMKKIGATPGTAAGILHGALQDAATASNATPPQAGGAAGVGGAANGATAATAANTASGQASASNAGASAKNAGLTADQEKKLSDFFLSNDAAAPAKPVPASSGSVGSLTFTPEGGLFANIPGQPKPFPGQFAPNGGLQLFDPNRPFNPLAPTGTPLFITGPVSVPTSAALTLPDGSLVYAPLDIALPGSAAPGTGGAGTMATTPEGAFIFQPNTGGTPSDGFLPQGPGMGWGETEITRRRNPGPTTQRIDELFELGRIANYTSGNVFGGTNLCCDAGVQTLIIRLKAPVTLDVVEALPAPSTPLDPPMRPWTLRGVLASIERLLTLRPPLAARRAAQDVMMRSAGASWNANPAQGRSSAAAGSADAPPVTAVVRSLGPSQGEAFELQVVNDSKQPLRLSAEGVVVEPLKRAARNETQRALQQITQKLTRAKTIRAEGYCLQYGLQPPDAGMLFRIAPPAVQERFRSAARVLGAASRLAESGALHPDSDLRSYVESVTQYAVWTNIEKWDARGFADAWVAQTKKRALGEKVGWTNAMEAALRGAAPGRWRDIQAIVERAVP